MLAAPRDELVCDATNRARSTHQPPDDQADCEGTQTCRYPVGDNERRPPRRCGDAITAVCAVLSRLGHPLAASSAELVGSADALPPLGARMRILGAGVVSLSRRQSAAGSAMPASPSLARPPRGPSPLL